MTPEAEVDQDARSALLADIYAEGYRDGRAHFLSGSANPYDHVNDFLRHSSYARVVEFIEEVQWLRDLATLELARRDSLSGGDANWNAGDERRRLEHDVDL